MTRARWRLRLAVVGCAILSSALATTSAAQVQDHLECYRVRRHGPGAQWTANSHAGDTLSLAPSPSFEPTFALETGCRLKSSFPKEICVSTAKQPGLPPTGQNLTGYYACYPVVCLAGSGTRDIELSDQFGSGVATIFQRPSRQNARRTLCVPATRP
jgi:hypothetical protein